MTKAPMTDGRHRLRFPLICAFLALVSLPSVVFAQDESLFDPIAVSAQLDRFRSHANYERTGVGHL